MIIFLFVAMNIAANQAIYPQTATHLSYPNGAIIQNHLQQPASMVRKSGCFIKKIIDIYFLGVLSTYEYGWSGSINFSI
jgi:hypothetical protein